MPYRLVAVLCGALAAAVIGPPAAFALGAVLAAAVAAVFVDGPFLAGRVSSWTHELVARTALAAAGFGCAVAVLASGPGPEAAALASVVALAAADGRWLHGRRSGSDRSAAS